MRRGGQRPKRIERKKSYDTNVRLVEVVVGGAAERGIGTIVYISSVLALFAPGSPIDERSALSCARSPYAQSKAASEQFVRALQDQGVSNLHLVPSRHHRPRRSRPIRGQPCDPLIFDPGDVRHEHRREVLDVRDMAALVAAFVTSGQSGRHVVSGRYLPWPDAIALIQELTGKPVKSQRVNGALIRAIGRVGDLISKVASFDFPLSAEAMRYMTQWPGTIASPAIGAAGITLRDSDRTYADTITWLYHAHHITEDQAGNSPTDAVYTVC